MTDTQHAQLIDAVTRYDRVQSTRKGYNRYALGHYAGAIGNARELMAEGRTLRQALVRSFCGRLLDVCLKAVGEPLATRDEMR